MENKLKFHEKVCKNKYFCEIAMPLEKNKILERKQNMQSDKILYIIYADIEPLFRKINVYGNNPGKSSAMKTDDHIPSGYSMSTILGFIHIEKKHTLYLGKDLMKRFCQSLREHA